ncbi:MAG: hypothetical protein Kow0042_31220 [Calditrichia bacterium]
MKKIKISLNIFLKDIIPIYAAPMYGAEVIIQIPGEVTFTKIKMEVGEWSVFPLLK